MRHGREKREKKGGRGKREEETDTERDGETARGERWDNQQHRGRERRGEKQGEMLGQSQRDACGSNRSE